MLNEIFKTSSPWFTRRLRNDTSNPQPLNRGAEEFLSRFPPQDVPRTLNVGGDRNHAATKLRACIVYVHASRFLHATHYTPPVPVKSGWMEGGGRRVKAGKEGLYFLPFRLKFNARRTARVIGRDLFKRENYPEGVVEHRRFNSRLYGKRTASGRRTQRGGNSKGVRARSSFPPTVALESKNPANK